MFMYLSHRSGSYATVPAGWTLIDQEIDTNSVRGEVYWKRASGEGASYVVTGLTTAYIGFIRSYVGGITSGNPIGASVRKIYTNESSPIVPDLTVPDDDSLVICCQMGSTLTNTSNFDATIDLLVADYNTDLSFDSGVVNASIVSGGGVAVMQSEGYLWKGGTTISKIQPVTGSNRTGIAFAFCVKPETADVAGTGTRFYFSQRVPESANWHNDAPFASNWDYGYSHAYRNIDGYLPYSQTIMLSETRNRCGMRASTAVWTDQPSSRIHILRALTDTLEAQTISGTFDLCGFVSCTMELHDFTIPLANRFKCWWKVYIYITVGDTSEVRHVLLDFEDSAQQWTSTTTWRGLTSAQSLIAGAALAGDRVCIELGGVTSAFTTEPPHYEPDHYGITTINILGTARADGSSSNHIPLMDGVKGTSTTGRIGSCDFTHDFVYQTPVIGEVPTHISIATAQEITTFPFYDDTMWDIRGVDQPGRQVWYKFTAPETNKYIFATHGSTYHARIRVFSNDFGDPVEDLWRDHNEADDSLFAAGTIWNFGGRSDYMHTLHAQAGVTYHILVHQAFNTWGVGGNGLLRFSAFKTELPTSNDVLIHAGSHLTFYRGRQIVNATSNWHDIAAVAGLAIDYSETPMVDFDDNINTNPRIYFGLFNNAIVEIIDAYDMHPEGPELNYIGSAWDEDIFDNCTNVSTVDIIDDKLITAFFGTGFHLVQSVGSAWFNNVSDPSVNADAIREVSSGAVDYPDSAPVSASVYAANSDKTAPWHIRVNQYDPDVIFYTSGNFYVDQSQINSVLTDHKSAIIKRYSRTTGQLGNFATVPLATGTGVNGGLRGMDCHPNGNLLVCNGNQVDRLDSAGTVVQSYTHPNDEWKCRSLVAVRYLEDGASFWVFDMFSSYLMQFDIESGELLDEVDTGQFGGTTTQMAIWQPEGIILGPEADPGRPGCPGGMLIFKVTGRNGCVNGI